MGWEWTQEREAVLPRRARGPQPMPPFDGHIPHSALQLAETAVRFNTKAFGDFVSEWMTRLPYQTRKDWSYNGAVKSSSLDDPIHYRCPYTLQNYFDPGNWIYAQTLTIMCPSLMAQVNWNAETKGDICESLMGAHYEWSVIIPRFQHSLLGEHDARFGHRLRDCSRLIHYFSRHTYHLHRETGDERMLSWVHWIVSIVSWRKDHTDIEDPDVLVHEPNVEVVQGSRDKSEGFLIPVISDVVG